MENFPFCVSFAPSFANHGIDNANPGIMFGWVSSDFGHQYYNLLFSGSRLLLERVGFRSGESYMDFSHIDEGVKFQLIDGKEYRVVVQVSVEMVHVFIDNVRRYSIATPSDSIGRVGLRPWRTRLTCSFFEVTDL
ncbi:MAG: hypothetical protein H7839_21740 [Magnetococcus sp. YQC-5]